MVIMTPDKKTGGLKLKKRCTDKTEKAAIKADYVQNCCIQRSRQEQGFEAVTYDDRLSYGMAI